eukprot:5052056-Pyramimonas_sp.AAC.1
MPPEDPDGALECSGCQGFPQGAPGHSDIFTPRSAFHPSLACRLSGPGAGPGWVGLGGGAH